MDSKKRIIQRLEKLRELVKILSSLKGISGNELKTNIEKQLKAERCLQLAIEICIDISEMIITQRRLQTPQSATEAIQILGKEDILDEDFATQFSQAAGLRNILIHDYLEIDYDRIADKINNHLGDFETFAREIASFLQKE